MMPDILAAQKKEKKPGRKREERFTSVYAG